MPSGKFAAAIVAPSDTRQAVVNSTLIYAVSRAPAGHFDQPGGPSSSGGSAPLRRSRASKSNSSPAWFDRPSPNTPLKLSAASFSHAGALLASQRGSIARGRSLAASRWATERNSPSARFHEGDRVRSRCAFVNTPGSRELRARLRGVASAGRALQSARRSFTRLEFRSTS